MMNSSQTKNECRFASFNWALASLVLIQLACVDSAEAVPAPNLEDCQNLEVPAGNKVAFHAYAEGVQIYRWNGASWSFVGPEADLFANAGGNGLVGTHYAGPTWESNSGSKVVGTVLERCTPDATAIPWLLLKAVSNEGAGIFARITYIQRLNTVGGNAPTYAGDFQGEEVGVPYSAEYYFYRAHQ